MHDIHVTVVSPEEASFGVAEFWSEGRQIGFTRFEDSALVLRIEPRNDGGALVIGVQRLVDALAEANRLLAVF